VLATLLSAVGPGGSGLRPALRPLPETSRKKHKGIPEWAQLGEARSRSFASLQVRL
jgi:hypothetical protein